MRLIQNMIFAAAVVATLAACFFGLGLAVRYMADNQINGTPYVVGFFFIYITYLFHIVRK